jgi:O-methyltransferase involved in polyketide biosynthesis
MPEAVSRTATVVVLWRAMESTRAATTRLFEDPLAPAFLGGRFRWAYYLSQLPGGQGRRAVGAHGRALAWGQGHGGGADALHR